MKKIILFLFHLWLYVINYISKPILLPFLLIKLNVRCKNILELWKMRGPYLMLPNHTNQWDPFILSILTPTPIRWVTSDAQFREAFKTALLLAGAIPKVKEQSDMVTLQSVKEAMAFREVAGIFPEGSQNWDGHIGELIPATAKLVRFLKVPVVVPLIQGGYISKPRWAWNNRRCRIEVEFKQIINADEIQTLRLSEIEKRISRALEYDDFEWQKQAMVPLRSNKRAEHLELAHYGCPSCEGIGTFCSKGNNLTCSCGFNVYVDEYGFFKYPEDGPSFESPYEWTQWQKRHLVELFRDNLDSGEADPVLMADSDVVLMRGERIQPMRPVAQGEARLYRDRIEVGPRQSSRVTIPLKEATGANTFKQQKFEFRYKKAQYRFKFKTRHVSGYKWEMAYKGLRNLLVERGEW